MNNSAPYGDNIASYAVKYTINGSIPAPDLSLQDLVSGQKFQYPFTIELVDYDDQVISIDSSSTIEIQGDGDKSKTVFESVVKVNKGIA